jgi:hypothetical protein
LSAIVTVLGEKVRSGVSIVAVDGAAGVAGGCGCGVVGVVGVAGAVGAVGAVGAGPDGVPATGGNGGADGGAAPPPPHALSKVAVVRSKVLRRQNTAILFMATARVSRAVDLRCEAIHEVTRPTSMVDASRNLPDAALHIVATSHVGRRRH